MIPVLVFLLLPYNDQFLLKAYCAQDSGTSIYMNFISELGGPRGLSFCRALPYQAPPRSPDLWRIDSTYRRLAHSGGSKGNLVMSWLSLTNVLDPYSVRECTDKALTLASLSCSGCSSWSLLSFRSSWFVRNLIFLTAF